MLDRKWVVANLDEVKARLAARGGHATDALAPIEKLAHERRQLILASERQRAEQKRASEQMRSVKADKPAQLRARLKGTSVKVKEKEARLKSVEEQIDAALLNVPNLPHASVPRGDGPEQNQFVREWGTKPAVAAPKEH